MYKPKRKPIKTSTGLLVWINVVLSAAVLCGLTSKYKFYIPCFDCDRHIIFDTKPLVIHIIKDKVSLEISSEGLREQTLIDMGELYNIDFSDEEKAEFKQNGIVGVPLSDFKTRIFDHYLDNKGSEIPGIPCRADNTELFDWIMKARIADVAINQRALTITIKADSSSSNNTLKQVEATLLKQHIQRFNLITDTSNKLLHFDDDGKLLSAENNPAKIN